MNADNINETIRRILTTMDRCLDGVPVEEVKKESALNNQANSINSEILKCLKIAGISRDAIGPDVRARLEHELAFAEAECANELSKLRENERNLRESQKKIADLDNEINEKQKARDRLTMRIGSLERHIQERSLFAKIWYLLFTDEDKAELESARAEHATLQQKLDALNCELQLSKGKRSTLENNLVKYNHAVAECKQRIRQSEMRGNAFKEAVRLAGQHGGVLRDKDALKQSQKERDLQKAETMKSTAFELKEFIGGIRTHQPSFSEITPDCFGKAGVFPDVFLFGTTHFTAQGRKIDIPRILPFPIPFALHFTSSDEGVRLVREFILRSFQCLPAGSLEITVCDPVRMGASMEGFQLLLGNRKPFPEKEFLTRAKDIEDALSHLHSEIVDFLQKDCTGEIRDWTSYNAVHTENPRTYRLLIMFDMEDQLTDTAAAYLAKIIENGPKCGILPILGYDPDKMDTRRRKTLVDAIDDFSRNAVCLRDYLQISRLRNINLDGEGAAVIPDPIRTADLLRSLCDDYAKRDRFAGSLETLWKDEPLWSASSVDGIEAPIGWREDDRSVRVKFAVGGHSVAVHHALLGGKSGSGKSNLIHVLLHSLCHRYSPRELNLFLLDYKESIEFNGYANPTLPHASGIATESDVEYGLSVLRHLEGEMKRRAEVFKGTGTRDIYEFRMKTGGVMPRILLVVDEFQRLFGTSREGGEAESLLGNLLRQGRSAGIHLLLATQTLHGLQNLTSSRSLLTQISCRIALACTPEDSITLLQNDNLEASSLVSPPQGIINCDLGVKSANVKFIIPEAVPETRQEHLNALHRASLALPDWDQNCHVFSGASLPSRPTCAGFTAMLPPEYGIPLLAGRTADFEEEPVFADIRSKNLLVIGRYKGIPGLKESIAESLAAVPGRKSIMLYSEHPEYWGALNREDCSVTRIEEEWKCENIDEFSHGTEALKFVILDGFENLRALHSTGYFSRGSQSPADILKNLVERPSKSGVQLILCFRDYTRALSIAKDLLAVCDLRICDGSVMDISKFVEFDTAGARCKVELNSMKAVLVDRDAETPVIFRPFPADVYLSSSCISA